MKDHYTKTVKASFTRWLMCLALITGIWTTNANAQFSVTTNGGSGLAPTYPSLTAAISALNGAAITSPVVITCPTGTETSPAGGFVITATGTAVNTITINGNGAANSIITAPNPAGTAGALNDAIFKLIGSDYITISGFAMNENAANLTTAAATNNMLEWGVALLYASTTNGSQNCTIQNNSITLNRVYQNTFGIYSNSTHSATTVTTSATATTTAGGNTGLKIYGNTISNVNNGIVVVGPTAAADHNNGIDIGGTGGAQANSITNYGTTGTFSAFANVSGTVNGILVRNSINANISFNTITSSVGGVTAGTLNGIQVPASSTAPTATFTNTINSNSISLKSGLASGAMTGISYPSGSSSATSTLNINSNDFNNWGHTVAASGTIIFITVASVNQFTTINSNTFTNITVNTTGSVTFIAQTFTAPATATKSVIGNQIVTQFSKTGAGGTVLFVTDNGLTVTGAVSNCQNNNFSNMTFTGATTITGLNYTDGGTAPIRTVSGNTFNNITGGTSTMKIMNFTYWSGTSSMTSNTITNITGQGAITGITIGASANNATLITIGPNTINNLSSTGTGGSVTGITCSNTSTAISIRENVINTLSTTGATSTVTGIIVSGATATSVFRNKIYDLSASAVGALVNGMTISGGSTVHVYNNLVGDLRTPAATGLNAISGINVSGGSTVNLFFNSVYLNATSSGATFGSSCVTFGTTPTLSLRNNNLINLSTPGTEGANLASNGVSAVLRRTSGTAATVPTNYATSSNRNNFWVNPAAGTDNHATYVEGTTTITNSMNTIALMQAFMVNRDQASFADQLGTTASNVSYLVSTAGSNANFLNITGGTTTQCESGADVITTPSITNDYSGATGNRSTTPDVGAWEFAGTSPTPSITLNSITPSTNQCAATARLVSVNVTTPAGVITGVTITYNNGTLNSNIPMTNTVGNTWEYTIPAASPTNATVSWSITATNSAPLSAIYSGASYTDDPLFGVTASITASANPICAGSPSNLTAALSKVGTSPIGLGASTSSSGGASFFVGGWGGAKTQYIIRASELIAAGFGPGNITSLAFEPTTSGQAYQGFNLSIGHTTATDLASAMISTGLTQVYLGTEALNGFTPVANVVNTLTFGTGGTSSSFNWDGTQNIVLSFCWSRDPVAATSSSSTMKVDATGFTCARYGQSDNLLPAAFCALFTGFGTSGTSTSRPKFILTGNTAPVISSITWNDGVSNIGSTNPISVSPSIATTYTATIVSSGCNVTPSPSISLSIATPPTNPTANNAAGQCPGVPVSSVTSTSGIPTPTFKWYSAATGGTMLQQSTSTTYTTSISTTTTFHVSEIDLVSGCESGRVPVVCTVHTLSITSGVPNFCSSGGAQSTTLTAVSSNGSFTYAWSGTSGTIVPATGSPVTISISATTDYTLTATDGACVMTTSKTIGVYDFPNISLTSNGPVCEGSTISLNSGIVAGSFTASCITPPVGLATPGPGAVQLCNAGSATVSLSGGSLDDGYWNAIPIPFTFNYFGTGYTSLNIGTNGNVNFGATGTTQYNFTGGFPSLSNPANTIAVCARDLQLNATGGNFAFGTGTITYWTEGTAPNRKFIVQYANCATWYSTNASDGYSSAEAVFYETIGSVDIRVIAATNPAATTGTFINDTRNKYIGLQDGTRTVGATSPNCNTLVNNYWNGVADQITTPQAWRFDPASHYTITWTGTNLVPPTTGTDLFTISTTAMNTPNTYNYTFVGTDQTTGCSNSASPASINVVVNPLPVAPTISNVSICGPQTVTLTVSNAATIMGAGGTLDWYDVATGGTSLFTGASFVTPVITFGTSYWVESVNNGCANAGGRTQVNIIFTTPPSISPSGPLTTVCPGDPITLNVTSSNPDYTYVWTPGSLTGALQNINAPASTTTYTVTATDNTAGPFATCSISNTVIVNVHNTSTVNAGADQFKNIGGTATLNATYQVPGSCLKISEVIFFGGGGTGDQATWPAFLVATDDDIELTNTGTLPADISGMVLNVEGGATATWTFPSGTIVPAGGLVICHSGTGTDDLANFYFNDASSFGWSSGTSMGVYLLNGVTVVDAVAFNGYTFSGGSGVLAADFSGSTATSASGFAGAYLDGPDVNSGTNWIQGAPTTNGYQNPSLPLTCNPNPYTITWSGGNLVGPVVANPVTTPVYIAPVQTYTYTVSLTDGVCTTTDNIDITTQMPTTPTADFTVNSTSQTTGYTTSTALFTDISINVPDTWLWNITGPGTVTYVNSTTSASQNPQVQFGAVGQYTVALTVTNAAGNDTKTLTNYITVTATYCPSNATNTADEEIYGVIFAGISNPSTCATTGGSGSILNEYSNYTGITPGQAAVGYTYPFTLNTSACGTGTFSAGYSVFIDFNGDGDFDDLDEKVLGSVATTPIPPGSPAGSIITQFTGSILIPATANLGLTRMRVVLTESNATPLSCGTYGYGETEDYTINLFAVTAAPNCVVSSTNNFTCITAATISWPAASGYPTGYNVSYGLTPAGNDLGTFDVGNVTTATLPILNPSTLYYYVIEPYNAIGSATGCTVYSGTSGGSVTQTPTQSTSSYTETIDNSVAVPALPCGMTGSDENFPNDGVTWKSANGAGNAHAGTRYLSIDKNPNNTTAKDDWFYSAPMNLTAGKLYRIYFWHRVGAAGSENFEVFLSNSNDAATMLTTSAVFNGASNLLTYKLDSSADILPAVGGIYYYGFHANGAANGQSLYMDDIQVKQIPVAAMDPASCVTIPSLYDQLLVQPVYQAQDYKFKIENLANSFSYEYTRNLPIPDFRLKWAPGVTYDLTYDVSVSYQKNNIWSPYGPSCPVTMGPFPTTQLRGTSCGATLTDLYTPLYIDSVGGANDYEYRIVQNTLAYDHTWMRGAPVLDYRLYWAYQTSPLLVERVQFGFTYDVQVRALVGRTGPAQGNLPGTLGTFGPVCTVTLSGQPQTQLVAAPGPQQSCGKTLSNITDQIYCIPVVGASNYRYTAVNAALGYTATADRNSTLNDFRLNWLPTVGGIGLRYATTYDITVQNNVGGIWSTAGTMCQVTTPAQPLTQLQPAYCLYTLPTFSTPIYCNAVPAATNYRYRITDVATSGATYTKIVDRNAPSTDFRFTWTLVCCGGLNVLPNTPYNVEVASYAGGVWSAYGAVCTVTTSATVPRYNPFLAEEGRVETAAAELGLSVYPNPSAVNETYYIELNGIQQANEKVAINIYNVLGAKVYSTQVITKEESRVVLQPEQTLAAGVYTVEAQINGTVSRVKFVVK
jgi:hypothetical protein